MDAPPPEDIRPFVRIAGHLAGIGVSVPEIYAVDETQGLLLEEDFGNEQVSDYSAAVDTLIAMQRAAPPAGLPAWNGATMAATALATLFDWWWPAMFSVGAPNAALQDFAGALEEMLASVAGPVCFVHRDYFAGNLFWLPQRGGIRRIGALDFQDAAIGHPAYDRAAAGCAPRHPAGGCGALHGPVPGCPTRTGPDAISRRLCCLRRAAAPAACRAVGAPRPA
jgi:aminoglycoside/choline kinase family phosphotransferase